MSNTIARGDTYVDLAPALELAEFGDFSDMAIAAWWANSAEPDEYVQLDLESEATAKQLLYSGCLHAVTTRSQHGVTVNGEVVAKEDLLRPSTPKPPNADWYVYDSESDGRSAKTRVLPNLDDPRTYLRSDGELARGSTRLLRLPLLCSLTPHRMDDQRFLSELDTAVASALRNVQQHAQVSGRLGTALAVIHAEDSSLGREKSWKGGLTVIDNGIGIPASLVESGTMGVSDWGRVTRWSNERIKKVSQDPDFVLTALHHLVTTKLSGGSQQRDPDVDVHRGYGIWTLRSFKEARATLTLATTDQIEKGGHSAVATVSDRGDVRSRWLDVPLPTKGTLVHIDMNIEGENEPA